MSGATVTLAIWTILFLVAALALIALLGPKIRLPGRFSYRPAERLMSPQEWAAFNYLRREIGEGGHICPKVRIADLLAVENAIISRQDFYRAFAKIAQKHVDFVVIDARGGVKFAVEVDDRSHERRERRHRDVFVNAAFATAGVDLIRVKPRQLHLSTPLRHKIDQLGATS